MTTRMQQRRGTTAEWNAGNPVLAAGEIGINTTVGHFKIGDGVSTWSALTYFADLQTAIDNLVANAPGVLNTLEEIANAIDNDPDFYLNTVTSLGNHTSATTLVHGVADMTALITSTDVDTKISTHNSDTTSVHGITDSANLVYTSDLTSAVSTHNSDTTAVHGIPDTSVLMTQTQVSTEIGTHNSDTTAVHGIADTSALATKTYADQAVITHDSDTTSVHGIADTSALATKTYTDSAVSTHSDTTTGVHGITDSANIVYTSDSRLTDTRTPSDSSVTAGKIASDAVTTVKILNANVTAAKLASDAVTTAKILDANVTTAKIADSAVTSDKIADLTIVDGDISASAAIAQSKISGLSASLSGKQAVISGVSDTEIGYLDGVTSAIQTQLDAKAPIASPTFTGTLTVPNLTVTGTTTTVNSTNLEITDPLIYIGTGNSANANDLGLVGHFDNGTYQHTGLARDASDGKWKLFSGVTTEPSGTIDFTTWTKDTLVTGPIEATTVTPSSGVVFSDGTQTKEGTPSRTPIIQKTAAYTLSVLTERDSLIEVSHTGGSAVQITIPTDATLNFPIGTSIDILQTNTGGVTVAAATPGTTTLNYTPGATLRTQWSSATLFKRAANTWVLYGDLK